MVIIVLILATIGVANAEGYAEFRANSNNNPAYAFVRGVPCDQGLSSSGYAVVPTGRLFLKQLNHDGTVGKICNK